MRSRRTWPPSTNTRVHSATTCGRSRTSESSCVRTVCARSWMSARRLRCFAFIVPCHSRVMPRSPGSTSPRKDRQLPVRATDVGVSPRDKAPARRIRRGPHHFWRFLTLQLLRQQHSAGCLRYSSLVLVRLSFPEQLFRCRARSPLGVMPNERSDHRDQ